MNDHPSQWIHSGLTCRDVAERATDYLEDRVPSLTAIRIGLHLTSCADCRSYVMQIGLVSSALRSLPKLYPTPVNRLRLSERFAGRHAN
jgi:predicted anti-sigma-YlaC factor YlaD